MQFTFCPYPAGLMINTFPGASLEISKKGAAGTIYFSSDEVGGWILPPKSFLIF
jgi:hypothetical protein